MFGIFGRKVRKALGPVVCARPDHCISRKNIDPDALRVLYRLSSLGYEAYLVGGCVRDFLRGVTPHDCDITTSARPEDVLSLFDGVALRIGLSWLFGTVFGLGFYGFVLGYGLAPYGCAVPGLIYFLMGKWQKRKTLADDM